MLTSRVPSLIVCFALIACSRAPAEPEATAQSAAPRPMVEPLTWEVPGAWTTLPPPKGSPKRATYKVPKVGDDKEDAEVNVLFFGTGAEGDPDKIFKEMFGQFDGDAASKAKRDKLEVRGMPVEIVDTSGTFKIALGPSVGPSKKAPVQMVKESYRLYAAVVRTKDRGNWYFRMTGPDETVRAAVSAFRGMIESVK